MCLWLNGLGYRDGGRGRGGGGGYGGRGRGGYDDAGEDQGWN